MNLTNSIRNWLVVDFGWKLFSLLLAAGIWFTAHRILSESGQLAGDGSPITYGNLPVTVVSAGVDLQGFELQQSNVTVTVTGPPEAIGKLQANQIRATVFLTDARSANTGKQHVDVSVPPGITVVSVKPDSIGVIVAPEK